MKTTLLILFLTCSGLLAQTTPAGGGNDGSDTNRDEVIRRAMREALDGNDTNTIAPATNTAADTNSEVTIVQVDAPPTGVSTNPAVTPPASATNTPPAAVPPVIENNQATIPAPGNPVPAAIPETAPNANSAAVPSPLPQSQPPLIPPFRAAAPTAPEEPIIQPGQINFSSVDISTVLENYYAKLVNRTVLHGILPPVTITLKTQTPLTTREAVQALDTVLAMNQITMLNVGDKFVKAVPEALAEKQGAPFTTMNAKELPESDQYVTQIVQLKNARPSEMVPVLQPLSRIPNNLLPIDSSQILVIRDYSSNVKRMLELIKQVDIVPVADFDSEVIPIKYALASDIASALGNLGASAGASIGSSRRGGFGSGGGGGAGGGFGQQGGGFGQQGGINGVNYGGGAGGFGTQGGQPNTFGGAQGAGARTTSFTDRLSSLVSKVRSAGEFQIFGQTKIIADERTNSLLVFAGKQDMKMIKDIVKKLDVVLAQVLIEAIIMEVSLDDTHNLGVSYLQTSPSHIGNSFQGIGAVNNGTFLNQNNFVNSGTSNGAAGLPSGFSYLANFGNDFQATITAIATDSRINVLSRPRIQTSHAVPATIRIGDTVPYVTGTFFGGINGTANSQYQQTFVGINLQVTPLINPDGLVVMDIDQDVQQLGTPTVIDGNQVPTTTERYAHAEVSVKDRDTIILGGFISSTKSKGNSGVPFLKDIPGLGYLFRSSSDETKRVELIVLIHPTVLPTPEAAALVANRERDRLPGVKAAEKEYQEDEARRLKAADKISVPRYPQ